jgi:hypothetical protein
VVVTIARICLDSTFFDVDADGNLTFNRGSVGIQPPILTFTTPGTYSFTKASFPGLTRIRVTVIGGGGGGAGGNSDNDDSAAAGAGDGGAGGGMSMSVLDASVLGATETIVVGAGGTGGPFGMPAENGTAGGDSSFGGLVIAKGGAGGQNDLGSGTGPATSQGTNGPALGTGQIRTSGQSGGSSIRLSGTQVLSGRGGDSGGGYGQGGTDRTNGPGQNGRGVGGGGSGGAGRGSAQPGGNGAPGGVFIEIYL